MEAQKPAAPPAFNVVNVFVSVNSPVGDGVSRQAHNKAAPQQDTCPAQETSSGFVHAFHASFENGFGLLGGAVASRPWITILIACLVAVVASTVSFRALITCEFLIFQLFSLVSAWIWLSFSSGLPSHDESGLVGWWRCDVNSGRSSSGGGCENGVVSWVQGLLHLKMETRVEELWVPDNTQAKHDRQIVEENFPRSAGLMWGIC